MGQREDLEALRASLFEALATVDPQIRPQVAGQLRAVIKDLAEVDAGTVEKGTPLDQLKQRREAKAARSQGT